MNTIVSVDEAIAILMEYKRNGGKTVIVSENDIESGVLICGIKNSVKKGVEIIKKTQNPIEYSQNRFINSLMTEIDTRRKTILFSEYT